jgi:hypothetical protein
LKLSVAPFCQGLPEKWLRKFGHFFLRINKVIALRFQVSRGDNRPGVVEAVAIKGLRLLDFFRVLKVTLEPFIAVV